MVDIAAAKADVFQFTVGQAGQRIAGHARVVPGDEFGVKRCEDLAETTMGFGSELNAGGVDCSHFLVPLLKLEFCVWPGRYSRDA